MRAAKVFCTTLAGNPFYIFFLLFVRATVLLLLFFFGFWLEIALGIELNCFGNPRELWWKFFSNKFKNSHTIFDWTNCICAFIMRQTYVYFVMAIKLELQSGNAVENWVG